MKIRKTKIKKFIFIMQDMSWLYNHKAQFSLGTLYISTKLKEAGVEVVEIYDTNERPIEKLPEADAYGFSTMYNTYADTLRLTRIIKKMYPDTPVIVGGVHPTQAPDDIDPIFDSMFIGEGEETIMQWVKDVEAGKAEKIYRRVGDVDITDLLPDRTCVTEDYIRCNEMFAEGHNYVEGGSTAILFTRGCPFLCSFCSSPNFWGRKVRYRPMESIVEEIKYLINDWGIRQFRVQDDTFTLNYRFVKELCEAITPLDIFYRCSTRVDTLVKHDDFSTMMYESGCREVGVGIEAADDEVLKKLVKQQTRDIMFKAIEQLQNAGIKCRQYFLIGTPYDTYETMEKNIQFIEETGAVDIAVGNLIPFPGDDLYINQKKHGIKGIRKDPCMNIGQHIPLQPNIFRYDISVEEHISIMRVFYDYLVEKGFLKGLLDQAG